MRAIILCAGSGTRLRPLTNDIPKCMIEYNYNNQKKPLINHILTTIHNSNITNIAIITGYKKEVLHNHLTKMSLKFYTNPFFATTNMVYTLFCAKEFLLRSIEDIIISYGDIIYSTDILKKLIAHQADIGVVIDKRWRELWQQRMDNPLTDAETLKIVDNRIIELGKKPQSYNDIEGQYIGLIKISAKAIRQVVNFYDNIDKNSLYDGQDFNNMYMTSFIQMIINDLMTVTPVYINGGWIEIDQVNDLNSRPI